MSHFWTVKFCADAAAGIASAAARSARAGVMREVMRTISTSMGMGVDANPQHHIIRAQMAVCWEKARGLPGHLWVTCWLLAGYLLVTCWLLASRRFDPVHAGVQ